jgi:hypothetical protein
MPLERMRRETDNPDLLHGAFGAQMPDEIYFQKGVF